MIARALLASALLAVPGTAHGQSFDDVKGLSVATYGELGAMQRAQIMEPVAKRAGIEYLHLNACLNASANHPILGQESVEEGVRGCIEWAKNRASSNR